jgi:hypothetical protein
MLGWVFDFAIFLVSYLRVSCARRLSRSLPLLLEKISNRSIDWIEDEKRVADAMREGDWTKERTIFYMSDGLELDRLIAGVMRSSCTTMQ